MARQRWYDVMFGNGRPDVSVLVLTTSKKEAIRIARPAAEKEVLSYGDGWGHGSEYRTVVRETPEDVTDDESFWTDFELDKAKVKSPFVYSSGT